MLEVGDTAPDFTLPGVYENEITHYTLSDHTAEGPVLLGVYVFDFSPVCSRQMCQLTDMDWYQYKRDLSIFGISTDGPYSHMAFAEQEDLGFPLLSDTSGEVLEAYGVLNDEVDGIKQVPQRALFLIVEDRTVQFRWIAEDNWEENDDDFGLNPVQAAIERL